MISIDIPGYKKLELQHLVLDFNGTLAIDGKIIEGAKPLLQELSKQLAIHVITADTFGTSQKELAGLDCKLVIINPDAQDLQKDRYVVDLGAKNVIAIGNGQNDALMLWQAGLSIMLMQQEGAFARLINVSHIVCHTITDALNLILNPVRIIATLRK